MQIFPLSEGAFSVDATKHFIPFNKEADSIQERNRGSLLVEVQPFVVKTRRDIVLIDAGLGFANSNGVLQIHQHLIDNGIDPLHVTKVLLSHLHKDHSGGIAKKDPLSNKQSLAFPNATHYVNSKEWDHALQEGHPSYYPEELEVLKSASHLEFIEGNGQIDGYIRYEVTAAHSPFHQVFWLEEDGEIIFFGADDAPQFHQLKNKFIAKYDHDGKKSMELRQKWWEEGQAAGWKFLFYHDIKTPVYVAK